jgi:ABC-type transporter Mla MlaB component
MDALAPPVLTLALQGPIARADLPALCDRIDALLTQLGDGAVVECDVQGAEPDAVTVDVLARLQLSARRYGCVVRLRGGTPELCSLVEFMGLSEVVCVLSSPRS